MCYVKYHFATSKLTLSILIHHFTISYVSDILFLFLFLCLIWFAFEALRSFHTSNFPSKVFFLYVLMVGFDFFGRECPSISFFLARLGVCHEYSSGRHPQAGLFVSGFTSFKPVLLTLYPLICHSLREHHLMMTTVEYSEDDVRSSELEIRLSSNAESLSKEVDMAMSKPPSSSSSPPLHALSESCSLKEKHLKNLRKRFQFPKGTVLRLGHPSEKACTFSHGKVCFYEATFLCSLHFPLYPFFYETSLSFANFSSSPMPRG